MKLIALKPSVSEKSYGHSQNLNAYVFEVPKNVSKQSVASAVTEQFKVSVVNVNITNISGKSKRTFLNKRGKFVKGTRSDVKKAFVTVKKGEIIPIFAAEEEAEKKAEKVQKAAEKAIEKKSKKEATPPRRGLFNRKSPSRTSVRGDK